MKDRIRNLLISGLKASEVVTIVGCSPSYISQLMKDEEFAGSVQTGIIAAQSDKAEEDHIDTRYQNLEHRLINSIQDGLASATMGEMVRALEVVNKRQDAKWTRKNPVQATPAIGTLNIVSLAMPVHAMKHMGPVVEMNAQQEIIAIEGRALAPMNSNAVKNLFSQIAERKANQQVLAEI